MNLRIGDLTILSKVKGKRNLNYCYCECGKFCEISDKSLKNGRTKCMGCSQRGNTRDGKAQYWGHENAKLRG